MSKIRELARLVGFHEDDCPQITPLCVDKIAELAINQIGQMQLTLSRSVCTVELAVREIERLTGSLPKTADGATIVPGMRLWWIEANNPPNFSPKIKSETVANVRHPVGDPDKDYSLGSYDFVMRCAPAEECVRYYMLDRQSFSTEVAAKAVLDAGIDIGGWAECLTCHAIVQRKWLAGKVLCRHCNGEIHYDAS